MSMTSEVGATDPRDGVFGLLGILGPGATQLTANYSLSYKHVFIGLLSHCLLNLGEDHVVLRACGTESQYGYPSWVPDWRSRETWSRILYGHFPKKPVSGLPRLDDLILTDDHPHFHEYELKGRHISIRPQRRAYICSRTGALHVCLTQYMSIRSQPKRVASDPGSYEIFSFNTSGIYTAFIFSGDALDKITFVGNEQIYIHTGIPNCQLTSSSQGQLKYLILRPVEGTKGSFRLIATSEKIIIGVRCPWGSTKDCASEPLSYGGRFDSGDGTFLLSDLQQLEDGSLSKFTYASCDRNPISFDGSPQGNWLIQSFFPEETTLHHVFWSLRDIFLTKSSWEGVSDIELRDRYANLMCMTDGVSRIEAGFVVVRKTRQAWRDRQEWQRYIHPENAAKSWEFRTKDTDWAVISRSSAMSSNEDSPTISSNDWVEVRSPISNLINNLADATSQTKAV